MAHPPPPPPPLLPAKVVEATELPPPDGCVLGAGVNANPPDAGSGTGVAAALIADAASAMPAPQVDVLQVALGNGRADCRSVQYT